MESRVPYRFNIINCEKASSQFNNGINIFKYKINYLVYISLTSHYSVINNFEL